MIINDASQQPWAAALEGGPDACGRRRVTLTAHAVPSASQVPARSVAAYFFQGRSTMSGKSIRTGAGTCFIM